jgi:hypothetical protein
MARAEINRYVSHRIPCIDIFHMSKSKINQYGKYFIKIDGKWQCGTSDIEDGFHEYITSPTEPAKIRLNKNGISSKNLNLIKKDLEFDGIIDYSLDLRQLIDYCEDNRLVKTYFKSNKRKNNCLALVKINFEKNTKEMREFLYRPGGFNITYHINNEKQTINYVRYKRTASGAREGSCFFIASDLYEHMMSWSCAGINIAKAKRIDLVSWEAYVALTLSSIETTIKLDPKQFLFVKDKETVIKQGKAFEITNDKGRLIQRHNIYTDNDSDGTITNKNKIWDGEGLIENDLFSDNEILKKDYSDKCMLLLRGKFFKACVFRTHIQKWFADNGISDTTHNVSDLNGYTQAKKISDIKFIIPYSCLKFLKFKNNIDEELLIKNWITDIAGKRTTPLFGIIKSDKKSKLMNGQKVFTTYQMLNTLGFNEETATEFLQPTIDMMSNLSSSGKNGARYVKDYLDNLFFCPSTCPDNYGEELSDNSDTFRIFHYEELTASKLLESDTEYYNTPHYKHIVESLLKHIKDQVMDGRVLIDGVYATLFCNGIELLKYSIDKKYDPDTNSKITIKMNEALQTLPVLRKTEIYSKRFSVNAKLLCARNPHITMGNFYLATNKKSLLGNLTEENIYDRYFVLSDEIVCVNAINSDIMNILNGCDFDSDTMLITDNNIMVDLLRKQLRPNETVNKFRVPFNNVKSKTITLDNNISESEFMGNVDDKLSNNLIGEIVNLSQRLNSLIWMLAPQNVQCEKYINWNKWTAEIGKNIYEKGCCTLAVLSNIEIDSAKRSYQCNTKTELEQIRAILGDDYNQLKSYTSWLDNKEDYKIPIINFGDTTLMGHEILGLDPMGYIIKVITTAEVNTIKEIPYPSITNYDFLNNILNKCKIPASRLNCEASLNKCMNALIKCYDHLNSQNVASKEHRFFKRNYVNDCMQIIQCCKTINTILCKESASSASLLWKLIELTNNSSRLIKFKTDDKTFTIIDKDSDEYKKSLVKDRHDVPRALLWAALFCCNPDCDTYLSEKLNTQIAITSWTPSTRQSSCRFGQVHLQRLHPGFGIPEFFSEDSYTRSRYLRFVGL